MKPLVILLLLTVLAATANAAHVPAAATPPPYNYEDFAQAMNHFNAKMYKQIIEMSEDKNVVFSPLSISQVLGMILAGARTSTRSQIMQTLGVPGVSDLTVHENMLGATDLLPQSGNGPALDIANGIFVQEQYQLYENYTQLLQDYYNAVSQSFNPSNSQEASDRINQWVADQTNDMIQKLVNPGMFNGLTRLALLNAVYFNGQWKEKFTSSRFPLRFHLTDGSTKNVERMRLRSHLHRLIDRTTLQMDFVAIPYSSGPTPTTIMVIGKPINTRGLTELTPSALKALSKLNPSEWAVVDILLTMPKFNVSSEINAKKVLQKMGITKLFNRWESDLSGMNEEPLYCSDFVHKSKIEVDEKGTRAAAATVAIIMSRTIQMYQSFVVNKPFFFGIYNVPSKMFVFMGRVNNPLQE